jgi:hypothetical protein
MATIVRYVNTASSGGDGTTNATSGGTAAYASLSAAEAALRQDLTSVTCDVSYDSNDTDIALDIRCTGTTADTAAAVSFANASWVTNATHRIGVRLNPSDSAPGAKWDTAKYRLSITPSYGAGVLAVGAARHIALKDLQVEANGNADNSRIALFLGNFAFDVKVIGGFYRTTGTVTTTWDGTDAIQCTSTTTFALKMRNVTAVTADGRPLYFVNYATAANLLWAYNCTWVNRGGTARSVFSFVNLDSPASIRVKNLLIQGTGTTNYVAGVSPAEALTILTQDTTAPGTGLDSKTITFTDASNWDYRLASGDTDAIGAATDLTSDTYWPFATDAKGTSRPAAAWDIGADEYGSSQSNAPRALYHYRRLAAL